MQSVKKIWKTLNSSQRIKLLHMFFLTMISMFLEILGVGLAIPAINLLIKKDIVSEYPQLMPMMEYFNYPTHLQIMIFGMVTIIIIYLIKNLYIAYFIWFQNNFSYGIQIEISQRLYDNYLHQPYVFHLKNNSALLMRNIHDSVSIFQGGLQMVITIIAELLVFIGIVVLLLYVEPLGALIIGSLIGIVIWVLNVKSKKYFEQWGSKQQYHSAQQLQHLMQGLGGVKEVKLLGREKKFSFLFYIHQSASNNINILFNFMNSLPRLFFEFLAIAGLASLVIIMVGQNYSTDKIIVTLGLFAMAAFRLMPSTNKIVTSVQSFWHCKAAVEVVYNELKAANKNILSTEDISNKDNECDIIISKGSIINLKNIYFTYPSTNKIILDNINLTIKQGESVGFIGPSGSGKTTLVDIILGLLNPDSGETTIDGINIHKNLRSWQNHLGYVPQSIYLTDDTLRKNIALGLEDHEINEDFINKAIISSQLQEMVKNLPDGLNTKVGERGVRLSGGQKQRIGIARALYHDPEILVLDEATSSLDSETESGIVDSLRQIKGKKTIFVIAHRNSTVEHCDRLIRISEGKIQNE